MTIKRRGVHAILIAFIMIFPTAGIALGARPADNTKGSNGNPNPGNPHETAPPSGETAPPSGETAPPSGETSPDSGSGTATTGNDGPSTSSNSGFAPATGGTETAGAAGSTLAAALPSCDTSPTFGGIFELDGDAVNDPACAGDDWNSVNKTFVADKIGKAGDNTYFFQGGSKDILDVSDWRNRTNDEAPDKDDITNAYAKPYIRNGELIVVFGADRYSNNGDAQMGFWFFQDSIDVAAGTFDGLHRVGDILVLVDFTNGGAIHTMKAYKWVASGGDVDTHLDEVATGVDCRTASAGATACGAVNVADADAPWDYTPKAGTSGIFPTASFFEGAINITALAPETECISSYLAETRTSQEPSARLKDFALGDFELCPSLLGNKFHDLNADGTKDAGEPTLAGWDIHLFGTTNRGATVHLETVTDANGAYSFDLQPGTYTVCEGTKDGWFQSLPANGPSCAAHAGAAGFGYTVELGLGVASAGKNFGNFQNATVQGFKFRDNNGNAVRDVLDPPLGGVRLHLFGTTGGGLPLDLHTTTDALGTYGFVAAPGTYTLCEDIPAGWTQSFPASGPACAPHGDGAGGFGHSLTLTSGQSNSNAGFGNFTVAVLPSRITRVEDLRLAALPATGIDAMSWAFLAAVMITIGSLMLVGDRRRRAFLSAV